MSGRDTPRIEAPLAGCCHCGNVELALETNVRPEELSLRADTCSFCRKHGARTTSDPSGRVVITVHRPEQLLRYLFGLRTADFLVCGHCGIYVAAVIVEGSSSYATVNVNTLDAVDRFTRPLMPVTYEGETGYSIAEAATMVGLDPALVERMAQTASLGAADGTFGAEDVAMLRGLKTSLEAGFPEDALEQFARVYGDALGRVAESEAHLF